MDKGDLIKAAVADAQEAMDHMYGIGIPVRPYEHAVLKILVSMVKLLAIIASRG